MELNTVTVQAEVYNYAPVGERYYVKLTFHEAYISGIVVQPSTMNPGTQMVNMPSFRRGMGGWGKYIEFKNTSPVKKLFEDKAFEAVRAYLSGEAGPYHQVIDLDKVRT